MIHSQRFVFEENQHENGKNGKGNRLLDHLQLPQIERASVFNEANPVGGHLAAILEEGNAPAEQDHHGQRELREPSDTLQFQVAVPR